jgi:RIO kinase 1
MPKLNPNLFLDEDLSIYGDRQKRRKFTSVGKRRKPREVQPEPPELEEQIDSAESFNFSYQASRHERSWIVSSLGGFYEGQVIGDVLRLVKGGKEASVYQCSAGLIDTHGEFIAAKVYRPRIFRNLRNDHLYREGRADLDSDGNLITEDGMLQAISQRSDYGRRLMHTSWIEYEYQSLVALRDGGADVPVPYARGDNAILMEYIGDARMPAPTLNSVNLEQDEAERLFERVLNNIEIMLAHGLVHGDLSAFNILYWDGEITLIDFPQVVRPDENRNAYYIFKRDVTRVCEYFADQGVRANPARMVARLWKRHGYRLGPEVNPAYLDAEDPADRAYWERYGG